MYRILLSLNEFPYKSVSDFRSLFLLKVIYYSQKMLQRTYSPKNRYLSVRPFLVLQTEFDKMNG